MLEGRMRAEIVAILVLLLTPSLLAPEQVPPPQGNPQMVSIVQLIASPEKYDRKPVTAIGCLKFGSESIILFLGCEDAKHYVTINGIWIEPGSQMRETLSKLDGKYVLIVGTFTVYHANTLHSSAGEMTALKKVVPWYNP
jgi:hypothetical protein